MTGNLRFHFQKLERSNAGRVELARRARTNAFGGGFRAQFVEGAWLTSNATSIRVAISFLLNITPI